MNRTKLTFAALAVAMVLAACQGTETETPPQKPNILFAIMDDATYMHMSAYGCAFVNTPNFDRVAKNGILFKNAYTPNAKCSPSRSCILTGRNSWQLEQAANHWPYFPEKFKVFTEVLAENGYAVASTGKGWAPGIATRADGSKRNLMVNTFSEIKTTPPTSKISNVDYAANFTAFLDQKGEEPFFFWYGGLEPHRAYEYGSGIAKGGKQLAMVKDSDVFDFWPAVDSVKTDLLDYAFEIEYFDKQLGKMLDTLEARGQLSNTLVVITADNGMPFPRVKGQEYEYSNHLPLAVMWADGIANRGRKIDDYISFIDFAPTFLELAEVPEGAAGMQAIAGRSFTDILYSEKDGQVDPRRDYVMIGKERHDIGRPNDWGYPIRGLVKDGKLYLHNFETDRWPGGNPETGYLNCDGGATKSVVLNTVFNPDVARYWQMSFGKRPQDEFYDIANDPDCMENLALSEAHREMMTSMKNDLFGRLKEQGDPRMFGNGALFDQYTYSDKKGVNFYERYFNGEDVGWGWVNATDFQDLSGVKLPEASMD
ncbi:sulfatase family protein [Flavilitoribacter nigricans]|uniref:Heparan N-sulfatase n=1 Tax=Flavilitoribacter nigricans (strain ATCC 23147 / DSM 23189 / NBRC 102662 / NCIMB 1420 / SS-2) TaxID=1122177 RepID=A0A2D0NJE7_FLAN2|nr:sulfatase [Flavilitoribacter nigricans]PHN08329.1 heparan N-sulfatase [Flavilitoribacter nigricans DSM 23189 = NBRC 102662]